MLADGRTGHPAPIPDLADRFSAALLEPTERDRFRFALRNFAPYRHHFVGRIALDYGCSWGTSLVALLVYGARAVEGVEVDLDRVTRGQVLLRDLGIRSQARIHHVPDTTRLDYPDGTFDFVLVSAVLEHIPQPRDGHLREIWRVLAPGGTLLIHETPNKYHPLERHTTGLWFNHWLPSRLAHRRAVRAGRFRAERADWASSGWRGLGYWEMVAPLSGYRLLPERTAVRHRILSAIGLPASILDPYPIWVLQKQLDVSAESRPK